jgi:hypothetical protein
MTPESKLLTFKLQRFFFTSLPTHKQSLGVSPDIRDLHLFNDLFQPTPPTNPKNSCSLSPEHIDIRPQQLYL